MLHPMARHDSGLREARAFAATVPTAYLAWAVSQLAIALAMGGSASLRPALFLVGFSALIPGLSLAFFGVVIGGLFWVTFELTLGVRRPTAWAGGVAAGVLVGSFVASWSGPAALVWEVARCGLVGWVSAEVWWRVRSHDPPDAHRRP